MMIPGAWEARARPVAVAPAASLPAQPAEIRGTLAPGPAVQAAELPGWLKVSIFAGALLVVTWLGMAVFW